MGSIDLDSLPPGVPGRPTVTIDSGRGFWHFWKLETPQPVDGKDGPLTARVEAFGRGLVQAYGSDFVRNIDRIACLPGTINHKTGRRAAIIEFRAERTYDIVGFATNEEPPPHSDEERPPHRDFDLAKLSPRLRNLIVEGRYQDYKTPSEAIFAACVGLIREGICDEDIIAVLLNREYKISKHVLEDHKDPEHQAAVWVARARKKAAKSCPRPNDDRREIQWGPTLIVAACDEAEQALIQSGGTYQRLGKIVDIGSAKGKTADAKEVSYLTIIPRGNYALQKDLARAALFMKFDRRVEDWVPCDPPMTLVKMLKEEGRSKLPVLRGIITVPTLRSDGSILSAPGFDAPTGMIFDPNGAEFPSIPECPTKPQALAALEMLKEPLKDFPFVDDEGCDGASRSVALAGILTALIRQSLLRAPAFGLDAPTAGTGKSKIVDIIHVIAYGHRAAVDNWTIDERENEKLLGAVALSGRAALAIDNVDEHCAVGGGLISQLLTQTQVAVRILGLSENPITDTNMLVTFTGNNLRFKGDITRRVVKCRMDAKVERPETRKFDRDPVSFVEANRAKLAIAGLTVLRAWIVSKQKANCDPFGDYDDWTALVRGALIWLGEADPVKSAEGIRSDDPARDALLMVLQEWWLAFNDRPKTAREIAEMANSRTE